MCKMNEATLTNNMKQVHGIIHMAAYKVLKNRASAEEVVQETFMTYIEKHHTMRDPSKFSAWMTITAKRKAINRSIKTKELPSEYPNYKATVETPVDVAMQKEHVIMVRTYIGKLCEMDQEVLQKFHLEEKSLKTVQAELDVPMGTLKRRLCVARRRLKEVLDKDLAYE